MSAIVTAEYAEQPRSSFLHYLVRSTIHLASARESELHERADLAAGHCRHRLFLRQCRCTLRLCPRKNAVGTYSSNTSGEMLVSGDPERISPATSEADAFDFAAKGPRGFHIGCHNVARDGRKQCGIRAGIVELQAEREAEAYGCVR